MDSDPQYSFNGINEIRDRALMLSLGNEYLCKEIFLKKIGLTIASNVKDLANHISSLKRQLPGKFANEVAADRILKGIYSTARRLQEPDEEINEKCAIGVLGRELEASINSLARVVKAIGLQIEEKEPAYTMPEAPAAEPIMLEIEEEKTPYTEPQAPAADAVSLEIEEEKPAHIQPDYPPDDAVSLKIEKEEPVQVKPEPPPIGFIRLPLEEKKPVRKRPKPPRADAIRLPAEEKRPAYPKPSIFFTLFGWLRPLGHMTAALFTFLIKLFVTLTLIPVLLILVSILPFTYLAVTMETEEDLLKGIAQTQNYIQSQQEVLAKLDYQKEQISKRIESMMEGDLSRQDKVEVMDLYVSLHKLDEERNRVQVEVSVHEKKINEKQKKIEEIKDKSFLKRLLRL